MACRRTGGSNTAGRPGRGLGIQDGVESQALSKAPYMTPIGQGVDRGVWFTCMWFL